LSPKIKLAKYDLAKLHRKDYKGVVYKNLVKTWML